MRGGVLQRKVPGARSFSTLTLLGWLLPIGILVAPTGLEVARAPTWCIEAAWMLWWVIPATAVPLLVADWLKSRGQTLSVRIFRQLGLAIGFVAMLVIVFYALLYLRLFLDLPL